VSTPVVIWKFIAKSRNTSDIFTGFSHKTSEFTILHIPAPAEYPVGQLATHTPSHKKKPAEQTLHASILAEEQVSQFATQATHTSLAISQTYLVEHAQEVPEALLMQLEHVAVKLVHELHCCDTHKLHFWSFLTQPFVQAALQERQLPEE
jgi:hypothetical protein